MVFVSLIQENPPIVTCKMTSAGSPLTTHVLDTALGKPARNLEIILCKQDGGQEWKEISKR